jgi:hypothetical protein
MMKLSDAGPNTSERAGARHGHQRYALLRPREKQAKASP